MKFRITYTDETGPRHQIAIGDRDAIMDSFYDAGYLGVTVMVMP